MPDLFWAVTLSYLGAAHYTPFRAPRERAWTRIAFLQVRKVADLVYTEAQQTKVLSC